MRKFHFIEATTLVTLIEAYKSKIIGKRLKNLYVDFWPDYGHHSSFSAPIILELGSNYFVINYGVTSDMTVIVGTKDEIQQDRFVTQMLQNKEEDDENYYSGPFECGATKDEIDGRIIKRISVKRFSDSFESDIYGNRRPKGGDYFSVIRLHLDSGTVLCFCGASGICDGYTDIWCE